LPKLSFHLEGFLGIGFGGDGGGAIVDGWVLVKRAGGIAYTGSKDLFGRGLDPEVLEAILISRASDWEAAARVTRVSSCGL
jgi:hypothetical protein